MRDIFVTRRECISIHAAREGGDEEVKDRLVTYFDFNPRRP